MGKGQKNISLRKDIYGKYDAIFERNKDGLRLLEINSTAELIRVLLNLGDQHLPELLASVDKLRTRKKENPQKP